MNWQDEAWRLSGGYDPEVAPSDVPEVPEAATCGARYGRVVCYKVEGHAGTHAGVSKLEWG